MRIGLDRKLLPSDGREPQFLMILLHGKVTEDPVIDNLAEKWRRHMGSTLFAMPRLTSAAGIASSPVDIAPQAAELENYVAQLRHEYNLANDRIMVVGVSEGASLALFYGLTQVDPLCAIVSFSGDLQGFSDLQNEVKSRPPVLMVSGEKDPIISPTAFLEAFTALAVAEVPVSSCFRPNIGRQVDGRSAESALFFLRGVQSTRPKLLVKKTDKAKQNVTAAIKLVIWDLDETLWHGTLDDADNIVPLATRVDCLRKLNRSGIVSAICSKNDFDTARRKLEMLGLWDEFVFPRIAFVPKGAAIKALIEDMQLKPKNCLFVDDNDINLAEAKALLPELHVLDAKSEDCDALLLKLVEDHAHISKSRVEEYRSLESRVTEGRAFEGSRETFLQTCDIHVAIASSSDLIDFAPRIEELINRTNQLNYLKTRVQPGSMVDFVSEASLREGFALFAWDKFGYHGLVGFIAADVKTERLLHMAFSCRIMHMGIENVLLHRAFQRFKNLKVPDNIPVVAEIPSWITVDQLSAPDVRARILAEENGPPIPSDDVKIRFMANCQSGVFAHFSGLRDVAEIDSHPRIFLMSMVLNKSYLHQNFPPAVVHYVGSDFYDIMWPAEVRDELEKGLYASCAAEFCDFLRAKGSRLLVVGNPSDVEVNYDHVIRGVTRQRMDALCNVWKWLASTRDDVDFLDVDDFVGEDRMADCVHFRVDASRDVALKIRDWFNALPAPHIESAPLAQAG